MPIKVPSDQTVVVTGLKSYTDERQLNEFVERLGCKTSLPCKPMAGRSGSEKRAFLNYRSSSDARAALSKISGLTKREISALSLPDIVKDDMGCYLKSEGPNSSKARSTIPTDLSESDSGNEDEKLVDAVVEKLKVGDFPSGMQGSHIGNMARKNAAWRREIDDAGGVKCWCDDNAGKVKFVHDDGGGRVILDKVKSSFSTGDIVKLAADTPRVDRGNVPAWGVGVVESVSVNVCVVDFPEQSGWRGNTRYLTKASKADSVLADAFVPSDCNFDKHAFVKKKEANVFEFTGNQSRSEYGFVRGKKRFTSTEYFELDIVRDSSGGIAIGLCGDTFLAGMMLGWTAGSVGYHSDDGGLFFRSNGQGANFGPKASVGDKLGCGIICGRLSTSCFFTMNRNVIGRVLLSKKAGDDGETQHQLYPIVSASAPAIVKIDLAARNPQFVDVGCVLTTSKWQAKYNDQSSKWKTVSRQGPPADNGDVPVTFEGYDDIVWVPQQRLRKALGNAAGTEDHDMATFELACLMADDGDVIKVNDVGVHQVHQKVVVRKNITIEGNVTGRKPVISVSGGFVFEIRSDVSIKNVCIKSTGGSKSDRIDQGGAAGVVLVSGKLTMSSCEIQSMNGSGVAVSEDMKPAILNISACSIGPCGRSGLILNGNGSHEISKLDISDCGNVGLGTNDTVDSITIEGCSITKCRTGMKLVEPSDLTFKDCVVSNCSAAGIDVYGGSAGDTPAASFEGCSIKSCHCGVVAERNVTVKWSKNSLISDCKTATRMTRGAKLQEESTKSLDTANHTEMPCSIQYNSDKKSSSEGYGQVGSEEDNFARYFRLLHQTATSVLLSVFKASFKKRACKEWSPEFGKEVLQALPRESISKLGKEGRSALESGATDTWDITLLSSLLLFSPGYLTGTPEESLCKTIREHRNELNHNPPTFKGDQPIMAKAHFDAKWKELSGVISQLTANVLSMEEHQEFAVQIQEMQTHKYRVSEDREMRDVFNSELKSVTDRMSKIEESAVTKSFLGKALENLQSLFRSNGAVDTNKLPQKVVLSNKKTYTLIKKAGSGGMGTVFVAFAHDTNEHYAFKICDGGDDKRAEREAEVLRKLTKIENHENVVRFIESAIHNSHYVIIMELVKGISLEEWLHKRGRESCTWQETKEIILGIASGMAEVHKIEISHRDLKPGNVMFDEASGKVVIVDFGLSKQSNAGQTLTNAGCGGFGTKPYMSPEQVDYPHLGEVYLQADIWAIGIIWYEILSGITPFEPIIGDDSKLWASSGQVERASLKITQANQRQESAMIGKICGDERDWDRLPENLPDPIKKIIDRCLKCKKALRYQTAGELLDHLQDVFAQLSGPKSDGQLPKIESSAKPFAEWTVEEVCQLLAKCGFSEQATLCREEGVDGKTWDSLSQEELKADLGMSSLKLKRFKVELGR